MSMGDIVWLFFIFSAVQPMLRQQMLEAMRVRKISQLERERKSRVILLVHRQETMRFLGFPIARYIDINDSEDVLRAIQMTDADVPLDLVLHTPGGLVLAALQIAKAVREHKGKVTVFVPHYAMSGGMVIALCDGANHTVKKNLMNMQKGDRAFFYHSGEGKEIVGVVDVVREHFPD